MVVWIDWKCIIKIVISHSSTRSSASPTHIIVEVSLRKVTIHSCLVIGMEAAP
jgi:hypothetical protein